MTIVRLLIASTISITLHSQFNGNLRKFYPEINLIKKMILLAFKYVIGRSSSSKDKKTLPLKVQL